MAPPRPHLEAMDKTHRREAIRQYKERKVPVGIFALRCRATGVCPLDWRRGSSRDFLADRAQRDQVDQAVGLQWGVAALARRPSIGIFQV